MPYSTPKPLIKKLAPKTLRERWDNYFNHGLGSGEDIDFWNNELIDIEQALPFKDDVEHDKWSQMLEVYKGEPEFDKFMGEILKRTDSDYSGSDDANKYADQYFSKRPGGYKPNPYIVKKEGN